MKLIEYKFICRVCGCDRQWNGEKNLMWLWCFLCDEMTVNRKEFHRRTNKKFRGGLLNKIKRGLAWQK